MGIKAHIEKSQGRALGYPISLQLYVHDSKLLAFPRELWVAGWQEAEARATAARAYSLFALPQPC